VGITAGSREVPGRNACDRRHTYCIIIIIIIIIIIMETCPNPCHEGIWRSRGIAPHILNLFTR